MAMERPSSDPGRFAEPGALRSASHRTDSSLRGAGASTAGEGVATARTATRDVAGAGASIAAGFAEVRSGQQSPRASATVA